MGKITGESPTLTEFSIFNSFSTSKLKTVVIFKMRGLVTGKNTPVM